MAEISPEVIKRFVLEVMKIERRYGTELRNVKTNRQSEIRELVDLFAARELDSEDPKGNP